MQDPGEQPVDFLKREPLRRQNFLKSVLAMSPFGAAMRRLSDAELHILAVVSKHEPICIGVPVDEQWAPIAATLDRLSRPNPGMLIREDFDDGPVYRLSDRGRQAL